ncbi:MAG: Na/Pi symporter [candidate division WOR-3 bacterium]
MALHKYQDTLQKTKWIFIFIVSLYSFLLSINLLGCGLQLLGKGFAERLISFTANPIVALFIGILTTSIVQSSSATTSIVVGMVACQTLNLENAIFIIMGANIGTTITNTLVSLTHITRKIEFQRAFPAAIVHDFFNILSVAVLFPLELRFHILRHSSAILADIFKSIGGISFVSPLKYIINPLSFGIETLFKHNGVVIVIFAIILLFVALKFLVDAMKVLITKRLELIIDRYIFGSPIQSFLIGLIVTAIIQSSSVTTSLMVPLVGAGLLTIYKIYPYTLGANIGTTVTAILASLITQSQLAIQIAFSHLLFNIIGSCIWYPARAVPINLAIWFGRFASQKRLIVILYILVAFYLIPVIFIILNRML